MRTTVQDITGKEERMANPFVHLELNTPDLPKAKEFYTALFGWQFQDMDMGAPAGIYTAGAVSWTRMTVLQVRPAKEIAAGPSN